MSSSFHDRLAAVAIAKGETSEAFHRAAQRHANATWLFLVIGGFVWYFTSWPWALIPFSLAAFVGVQSVSATLVAVKLEKIGR